MDTDISAHAQVLASERDLLDAMKTSNVERLEALLHDDLLFNTPDGATATKAADVTNYRSGNIRLHTVDASDQSIRVFGDTAVVAVTVELKGNYLDQVLDGRFRYIRTWKRDAQGWKVIAGGVVPLGAHMTQDGMQAAPISNPALQPFRILIGTWTTSGTHGLVPNTILHGRTTFEWLEHGAFLIMRSEIDDPRFPSGIAIVGSDDAQGEYYMLTFDARGVSRRYDMTLRDNIWRWWRNAPGFFQRYEGTIVDGGATIIGKGELSKDGVSWEKDLDLTYTRVK